MLKFLIHIFYFAEVYTVMLAWVVIPLFFWACFNLLVNHCDIFTISERQHAGD